MSSILQKIYQSDPLSDYYNLDTFNRVFLTTDIDWAPDFIIEDLCALVSGYDFKLTAFSTHKSSFLAQKMDFLEIGLHPDYTRPDPQFRFDNKLQDLKNLYPEAVGLRCHRNFFGNNISDLVKRADLKYDASYLLWCQPFCSAFVDYNDLLRISYFWEDGIHCDKKIPFKIEELMLQLPGLKVLNVHPVLIYLNAPDDNYRREVTKQYTDLTKMRYSDVKDKVYQGYGIRSLYIDVLNFIKEKQVETFHLAKLLS